MSSPEESTGLLRRARWNPYAVGAGIGVAIIDSGVMVVHPEFAGRPNLLALNPQEPQPRQFWPGYQSW